MGLEEAMGEMVKVMLDSFDAETVDNNAESYRKLQELYRSNPKDFADKIQYAYSEFGTLVEAAANIPETEHSVIYEYIISGLYKHYHTRRIEKLEGSACSYDKSSFVESMTLKAIQTGENLSLYMDYTNVEQITEDKERQAYWSPTTVKDTDDAVELFWNWYQQAG